jgi:hypothetical protein
MYEIMNDKLRAYKLISLKYKEGLSRKTENKRRSLVVRKLSSFRQEVTEGNRVPVKGILNVASRDNES